MIVLCGETGYCLSWGYKGAPLVLFEEDATLDVFDLFRGGVRMAKRGRMPRGHSKSNFRKGAGVHPKNRARIMRGGYRL